MKEDNKNLISWISETSYYLGKTTDLLLVLFLAIFVCEKFIDRTHKTFEELQLKSKKVE